MPHASLLATFVGSVLGFMLGGLWYGPLFGKAWLAESGITPEALERAKATFNPLKTYGGMFLLGLLSSYAFGLFVGHKPSMLWATHTGLLVGLGFVTTAFASTYLWEGKSWKLLAINGGYHTVRFILIGVAFALLG
jgi:hypothetical protein